MRSAITNVTSRSVRGFFAFVLAISSFTALGPVLFSETARAAASVSVCAAGCDATTLQDAVAAVDAGGVITFNGSINTASQVTIAKPLTIQGNGHSILATFAFTNNSNNASIGILGTTGVIINNLVVNGVSGSALHGINVYESTGVQLNNVTVSNNDKSGLVVNGSEVVVDSITTISNSWHGINVDLGSGVTMPATLTVNGTSTHQEISPDIYVDNTPVAVSVIDTNNQYNTLDGVGIPSDRLYAIKAAAPTITAPLAGSFSATSPILNEWSAVSYTKGIAEYQVEYIYDDGHTFVGGPYRNVPGTQTSRNHSPTVAEQGGVTIRVRAIDNLGLFGNWSTPVSYTYDSIAPVAPVLTSPANGVIMNGASVTQSWSTTDTDVDYYLYESYNDAAATSLRWSEQFNSTSKTATNVGNAEYWWRVKAVDFAGNESPWSPLWKITIDNTAPGIVFTGSTPAANAFVRGIVPIQTIITDANPGPYNLRIENGAPAPLSLGLSYIFLPISGATNTYNWETRSGDKAVADGQHRLRATTVDQAGNSSTIERTITVDNTRPTISVVSPTSFQYNPANIEVNAADNLGLDRITANLYNETNTTLIRSCSTAIGSAALNGTIVCSTSGLADGTYVVRTNARDLAGNLSATQSISFIVDTTAPVVDITNLNDGDTLVGESFTIEGSTDDGISYELRLNGDLVDSGASFSSFAWNASSLLSGSYTLRLSATDAAGNTGFEEITVTLAADPTVTILGETVAIDTPTVTGTIDDANATLELLVNGTDVYVATNDGVGGWSFTFPTAVANGTYDLQITATDIAGNTDVQTAVLTVDVPAPVDETPQEVEGTDIPVTPAVQPAIAAPIPGAVLGDNTDNTDGNTPADDDTDVEGTTTENAAQADTDVNEEGTIYGLAWYWWLAILAGLGALIWFLIAAIRRRNQEA